jgi:hypothetical protein
MTSKLRRTNLLRALSIVCASAVLAACGGGGGSGGGSNVSVPNVVGSTQSAATTSITGAGLTVGSVTTQSSATVSSGSVISESPAAGSNVAKGSAVFLVVSSGTPPVSVPNVIGSSQTAATAAITAAGLTLGTVTMQSSATVVAGNVISESPAAGTSVASGSQVSLVVSTGAATSSPTLGGIALGLGSGAIVYVLNGADTLPITANGSFTFPTALTTGATYSVSIGAPQPSGQTCAVNNGTGTAASANITNVVVYCTVNVTTASLAGAYTMISDQMDQQLDMLSSLSFDGVSAYSGSGTTDTNGVIATVSESGTYAIAPINSIPYLTGNGGQSEGALEFNASAFALLTTVTGGGQPGLAIGVKQIQNATVATVNGTYTGVTLENTTPMSSSLFASISLNAGSGSFGASQRNTDGAISQVASSGTGTYTITPTGALTVGSGNGISGAVGTDGDLIVGAPVTSAGNGGTPGIYLLVKQGSGVTAATIDGVYTLVSLSTGSTLTTLDGKAYFVAMANGAFAGVYDENNAGAATTNSSVSGTYTLASDGTMGLVLSDGQTLTGTVSADGNVFVLADMTSGQQPTLLVGVRQ